MTVDIYVMASERTTGIAYQFLDTWLNGFLETAEEYEFPQYAEKPLAVYSSAAELIQKIADTPNEPHSIYWHNPRSDILAGGMLFFTKDGAMIVGVTANFDEPEKIAHFLSRLAATVDGKYGYYIFEEPPPDTSAEFIDRARSYPPPKFMNGSLIE